MRGFNQYSGPSTGGMQLGPGILPPFIKVMLIANTAIFILQSIIPEITPALGLSPARFFADFPNLLYQSFTYMFVHGGFFHLFFNMFVLWMFGAEIELNWGQRAFGKFYLLAGLAGALLVLIVHSSQLAVTIGASGAIYGIMIAYWLMYPDRILLLFFVLPMKVKWAIPVFMLIGFFTGGGNTAHMAHLGGAIFGLVYLKSEMRRLSLGTYFRNWKYNRQQAKFRKNRQKAEDIMKKVDNILDKINDVGIENLSSAERKILEQASSHLSEENSHED